MRQFILETYQTNTVYQQFQVGKFKNTALDLYANQVYISFLRDADESSGWA